MDQLPPSREDGDCYWRKRGDDYRIECKWKDHRTQRWEFASRVVHVDIDNRDFLEQMVAELEKKVQHAYDTRFDNTAGDAGIEQHVEVLTCKRDQSWVQSWARLVAKTGT